MQKKEEQQRRRLPATDAEYQHFAEQFIDAVLDPVRPWLVECVLKREFPPVPNEEHIASGQFAIKVYEAIYFEKMGPWWLYEALDKRDRETPVAWAFRRNPQFKDVSEIHDLFRRGMITGDILPLGRLIDPTFGRGTLRKIGELDSDIDTQEKFVKSL